MFKNPFSCNIETHFLCSFKTFWTLKIFDKSIMIQNQTVLIICKLSDVSRTFRIKWSHFPRRYSNSCVGFFSLNPKRAGLFWPISQPRGGGFRPPLKISETDRWNIKCVVLVDSYDPSESIGTKKNQNIPCMTSQWRHKWRHVKNTKITKNRQNHGFSLFFKAKVAFFSNDVSQSMLTHVLTPNKPNK